MDVLDAVERSVLGPVRPSVLSRAGREETTASSDMARRPLITVRATTIKISVNKTYPQDAWPHSLSACFEASYNASSRRGDGAP